VSIEETRSFISVADVSCKSGTGFVWYKIPMPIRTLFYSKPETGMHVTEMILVDDDDCLCFNMFSCCNLITNYELIIFVACSQAYFRRQK